MRMFLVVMCDMFLLLYLTALSQMEARPVSELTVQDYVALKESEEAVKRSAEDKTAELARTREEQLNMAERLRELEQKLQAAEEERQRLAEAAKQMEGAMVETSNREAALRDAREEARLEAERLARAAEAAAEREAAVKSEAAQLKESAGRLAENLAQIEEQRLAEQRKAEEMKAEAEAALAEAERAKQAALEAEQAAKAAQSDRESALRLAADAEAKRAQALADAAQAADEATRARVLAARSALQADRAEKEKSQTKERIQAITQKAQSAYRRNVESKRVTLEATVVSDDLIGSSERKLRLSGIPVSFGEAAVLFVPMQQIGFEREAEPDDFVSLQLAVEGRAVRKVYRSPGRTRLIGIVVPSTLPAVPPIAFSETLTVYMPTLIALRNGSEMAFRDSVRDLNPEHFVFQRDRLMRDKDGVLVYRQEGFRGTGDFGERLLKGDQIVDLDGNFLGIAVQDNRVLPIATLHGWKVISLDTKPEQLFKQLLD